LLLSCTGVDNIAVYDAERHLKWIKDKNEELTSTTLKRKRSSLIGREQDETKRKAEQTGAYGQRKAPPIRNDRHYTKEWQKWHGRWYQ